MDELQTKLTELRTRHAQELDRVRKAQDRADETLGQILALETVICDVFHGSIPRHEQSTSQPDPAHRTRAGSGFADAVRAVIQTLPAEFSADDATDAVSQMLGQSADRIAVRKVLNRLARQKLLGLKFKGRGQRASIYLKIPNPDARSVGFAGMVTDHQHAHGGAIGGESTT